MPELCAQLGAQVADPTPLAGYADRHTGMALTGARTRAATERIARLSRAPCLAPSGAGLMAPIGWARARSPRRSTARSRGSSRNSKQVGTAIRSRRRRSGGRYSGVGVASGTRPGGIAVTLRLSCGVKWVQTRLPVRRTQTNRALSQIYSRKRRGDDSKTSVDTNGPSGYFVL